MPVSVYVGAGRIGGSVGGLWIQVGNCSQLHLGKLPVDVRVPLTHLSGGNHADANLVHFPIPPYTKRGRTNTPLVFSMHLV